MRQSRLFAKTRKEVSAEENTKNAGLLIRAGFIAKEMAGVYSYLPFGLRVLNKVNAIIREEMINVGGVEILLSALQDKEIWEKSGRWSDESVDNWFKTRLKAGGEVGLGFTHEEPLTRLMKEHIRSFRDLPALIFQIQNKFRNESRAKSGLMRCREFLMKDLYSFCQNDKEQEEVYEKMKTAYTRIFERMGIGPKTYLTFASGGSFSKYSHEFQTESEAGEDVIFVDEKRGIAVNREVMNDEVLKDLGLDKEKLIEKKSIEVGNIFNLSTRFSEALDLSYTDQNGEKHLVVMGSYGIGSGRLIGTIAEVLSDEKGLVWPREVSPFDVHLIEINPKKERNISSEAERVYKSLNESGFEVLWDDRDVTAGEKFADSDLVGISARFIISAKTESAGVLESRKRNSENSELIAKNQMTDFLR